MRDFVSEWRKSLLSSVVIYEIYGLMIESLVTYDLKHPRLRGSRALACFAMHLGKMVFASLVSAILSPALTPARRRRFASARSSQAVTKFARHFASLRRAHVSAHAVARCSLRALRDTPSHSVRVHSRLLLWVPCGLPAYPTALPDALRDFPRQGQAGTPMVATRYF